ncbi:MAG: metallophosphoesterase family protein [Cytophagaceae bacterium]|nr:metallophosphoesterase family protein [Gemmatimonadaceae bacterium]
MTAPLVIGVISDTHGLVRPDVHNALAGVYLILHAGDVCGDEVLDELATIAPVAAVAGNCDPPGHPRLPARIDRTIHGVTFHVSHGHELGVPTAAKLLATYDASVIIYGHTHRPLVHREGGTLVLNPGAAGPRRFDIKPTVARLTIDGSNVEVELVELER